MLVKNSLKAPLFVAALFLNAAAACAGELILTNGDRLQGELVAVNKSSLTWKSDSFGNLTIDKSKVENFATAGRVKIQGEDEACKLDGMDGHYVTYHCGDSNDESRTELLALDSIVPFVEYSATEYVYDGKTSLSGNFSRGNKIEDDLELDADVTFRQQDFRHVMGVEYESKSNNDEPANEDYELLYRLDWFFEERWFWYNELRWAGEESKNIDERYTLGTGLGVQMWENPNTALALEGGLDYVKELLDGTDDDMNDPDWDSSVERSALRFATKFRYKLPFSAELIHSNEILYSLQDSEDWELSADLGLSVPLGQGLFSEYKFEYDFDNLPANDTKKEDTKFSVGIGYEW
ncbi:MAG: DUF481 domain-containing protein [Cellvibrionaceae bacterium]